MDGRVVVWAVLLLASAAATASKRGSNDPCAHHMCPAGEECVSHEVTCPRPPCTSPQTRIGECRAVNCTLPCRDGYECARRPRPCARPPCPIREECVRVPDACNGRCLQDELCLTSVKVKPCQRPPCAESVCVARGTSLTARHQPPPPSFCDVCQAPAVCVPTQVCRQYNECLFLPVCLTNCTAMWCGQGYKCQMLPQQQCHHHDCPLEPTCVPEAAAAHRPASQGELANRMSVRRPASRVPQCVVQCTPDEECRFMETRCRQPPCAIVARCVPRSQPPQPERPAIAAAAAAAGDAAAAAAAGPPIGGECPLDDLRQLASPAFCEAASLHQCEGDGECGPQRRCCDRGCGRSCLPTCRAGCERGTECRLVAVQCIGSPCPKVAQCVAAEEPELLPPPPPPVTAGASAQSRPRPQFNRPAAAAAAAGSSASSSASSSSSSSSSSSVFDLVADAPPIIRPGLCPVNDRQTQSKICFDNGSVDQCHDDGFCPTGQRCCLRGCQRQCRPICSSCARGLQCRLNQDNLPACLQPIPDTRKRRKNPLRKSSSIRT